MQKKFTKTLTVCLALSLVLGSFIGLDINSSATDADETQNPYASEYIINKGDNALATTALQHDCTDGQMVVNQINDYALPYGKAIGLTTGDENSHWNWYKTGIRLNCGNDTVLSDTTGIAFYLNLPVVTADTAIDFWFYISDNYFWNELEQGKPIYYIENGETEITESIFTWLDYTLPGHNMSGWDGFVFIPFSSLKERYNGDDRDIINSNTNFELRVSVARTPEDAPQLAGKTFIFDEVGFYTEPTSYIQKAFDEDAVNPYEYLINDGSNAMSTVRFSDGFTGAAIGQARDTRYGKAIEYKIGDSGWNGDKARVEMNVGSADLSKTEGIAFYAKVPELTNLDPALDVNLVIDNDTYWSELEQGEPIYYLNIGTENVTSELFYWGDYSLPLHNRGGFEGFVFIPFSSLKERYNGEDRDMINAAERLEFRFSVAKTDAGFANQTIIFDEFGFYRTPLNYVDMVKRDLITEIEEGSQEDISNPCDNVLANVSIPESLSTDNRITVEQDNSGATPYGSALKMTTGDSNWNNGKIGVRIQKRSNLDMTKTEGIAFYVKVPDVGALDTAIDVWLWNTDRYTWNELQNGSMVYYLEKDSENITGVPFSWGNYSLPLHNKSGFEGFVFIPFSSFKCTWFDNEGKDRELINSMNSFELRFNVAKTEPGLANQTFIFDEFGIYSDPLEYVKQVSDFDSTDIIKGDVNDDGEVNLLDLIKMKKAMAGSAEITTKLGCFDLSRSTVLDTADLILLCKKLIK